MAPGQEYDCPSASEVTLKEMGKIDQNTTKHDKPWTVSTLFGMYCVHMDIS